METSCDASRKWACSVCTYLNWPKALRCTQCETQRDSNDGPTDELTPISSFLFPDDSDPIIKISDLDSNDLISEKGIQNPNFKWNNYSNRDRVGDYGAIAQFPENEGPGANNLQSTLRDRISYYPSDTSKTLGQSGARNLDQLTNRIPFQSTQVASRSPSASSPSVSNSSPNQANPGGKWSCSFCTYDNWPRSTKCVMCYKTRAETSRIRRNTPEEDFKSIQGNFSSIKIENNEQTQGRSFGSDNVRGFINNRCASSVQGGLASNSQNKREKKSRDMDGRWLEACCGVVDGNVGPVERYLAAGGDPARQLTASEVAALDRPSAFDVGFTLVHLALRFHQQHVLKILLSQVDSSPAIVKKVPSCIAPDLAIAIRHHAMGTIRQRKGTFRCYYMSELATFALPSETEDLSPDILETLFDEALDRDVQKELEEGQIINWSDEVTERLSSRLYALWNRSAGDCLLDSVLQATWGIFDRDNSLRRALSDSLNECSTMFYQKWKENEILAAHLMDFSLNDTQCAADWSKLLAIASKPGSSLEQLHIFTLSHILRRPIIVYGVKFVKSFRGENLGFAGYEGVYLPFFWETSFCWKSPITLGYTRGHFSALVGMEPDCDPMLSTAPGTKKESDKLTGRSIYLPLNTIDGSLLPIHFLSQAELGKEETTLGQWLDVRFTERGVMVACQRIQKQPKLIAEMLEEWLNHYRRLGQVSSVPFIRTPGATCYSSDGESDE